MKRHEMISIVTLIALVCLIACITLWGKSLSDNRGDMQDYYEDTYKTLVRFSATWDRFMQVDEIEKELVRQELDSIRGELNEVFNKEVWRGTVNRKDIFTINKSL